jgi:hypothetical protein
MMNERVDISANTGVRMKGIQNKKHISETNCHTRIRFILSERKTVNVFFSYPAYAHTPADDLRRTQ